jgi:hypothetical protein
MGVCCHQTDMHTCLAFVPSGLTIPTGPSPKKSGPPSQETKPAVGSETGRVPEPGPRPNVNPNLDSFEAVMLAMDEELARSRSTNRKPAATKVPAPQKQDKGKGKAASVVEEEEDIDSAMDAELKAALERADDGDEDEGEEPMDYNLIKNFLESFKSQGGLSGPVSSLAGRLQPGWQLPRDAS